MRTRIHHALTQAILTCLFIFTAGTPVSGQDMEPGKKMKKWFVDVAKAHDTWGIHHDGTYHIWFVDRNPIHHISSDDGIHWQNHGPLSIERHPNSDWIFLCGAAWKSPNFEKDGLFIMGYAVNRKGTNTTEECFTAVSKDLRSWTSMGEEYDQLPDGIHYSKDLICFNYWYMLPREEGGCYAFGGMRGKPNNWHEGGVQTLALTTDGLRFTALPGPIYEKDVYIPHDLAGNCKINGKYFATLWNGYVNLVYISDKPEGVFRPTKRNHVFLGKNRTATLSRFLETPDGMLMNNGGYTTWNTKPYTPIFPLKKVIVDPRDGAFFLGWWPGNDAGKEEELRIEKSADGNGLTIAAADGKAVDLSQAVLLEADVTLPKYPGGYCGLRFQCQDTDDQSSGSFSLRLDHKGRATLVFDDDFRILHDVDRDIEYPRQNRLRVFMIPGLIEAYLGDYLIDSFNLDTPQFPDHLVGRKWVKENEGKKVRHFRLTGQLAPIIHHYSPSARVENLKAWR